MASRVGSRSVKDSCFVFFDVWRFAQKRERFLICFFLRILGQAKKIKKTHVLDQVYYSRDYGNASQSQIDLQTFSYWF